MNNIIYKNLMVSGTGNNHPVASLCQNLNQNGSRLAQAVFVRIFQTDHPMT